MTVWDYDVYFPYGATTDPYSPSNPHKGDDRCNKVGVNVTVNGIVIGRTGYTGYVVPKDERGAHLHVGRFVNGVATNPNKGGRTVDGGVVTQVGEDARNGKFVRVKGSDGAEWVYLHLSEITVKQGQVLKGGDMKVTRPIAELLTLLTTGWPTPTQDGGSFVKSLEGQEIDEAGLEKMLNNLLKTPQRTDLINLVNRPSSGEYVPAGQLYVKKG